MTMMSFVNTRRSRGMLVLFTALFISLLHASSASVKLGPHGALTGIGGKVVRRALTSNYDDVVAAKHTAPGLYSYGLRSSGSGRHSKGKGKGGGSVQQVAECYQSCLGDTPSPSSQPTPSPNTKREKPSCCKGGVSSLKMLYQGNLTGEIHTSSDGLNLVDGCDKRNGAEARKHKNNGGIVKFVSCSECFFNGTIKTTCDFSSDSIEVQADDEVCLAVFDQDGNLSPSSKMPIDLDLYFVETGTNEAIQTTLHTSCSKPIYAPFAVRLDDCKADGYPFSFDVSVIDIDSMIDHPVLVFVDGTSAKSPSSLFTDCGATYHDKENVCCKGGATFLKVRVNGTTTDDGVLTFNKTLASVDCDYDESSGSGSKSGGSKGSELRFVSCDDECLDPFGDVPCGEALTEVPLLSEDICFGSWNEETGRIDFSDKMTTNVEIFFVPDNTDSFPVQSAYVHTSCSKAVYPNWAVVFAEDCDSSDSTLVNLDTVDQGSLGLHMAFVDGVSRGYYEAAQKLSQEAGVSFFDINFADCGCNCDATAFPTGSPSPTDTSPTTVAPTPTPTAQPVPGPPDLSPPNPTNPPVSCEQTCASWVVANCNVKGDDGSLTDIPCNVTASDTDGEEGEGGRMLLPLLRTLPLMNAQDDVLLKSTVEEQIKWQDEMVSFYDSILSLFE